MGQYGAIIGGVVGAVVGSVVPGLGTSLGWAIGSALGGSYSQSQQVLPGPKIGDVAQQTAQEGGFRTIVYGRSMPIAGNIIADGGPVIVTRRERQGKGGPKVESESAYRTYAVGVCEGEAQLLQAWRNGILVYDIEDPSMSAENAKFLEYATWYTGTFDQNASPDLEEIYGAGQAPFFRGTAYLSIHNEDVTDQRGAWSQWQFRVARFPDHVNGMWWAMRLPDNLVGDRFVWRGNSALSFGQQEQRGPPNTRITNSVYQTLVVRTAGGALILYGPENQIERYENYTQDALPAPQVITICPDTFRLIRIRSFSNCLVATVNSAGRYYISTDDGLSWDEFNTPDGLSIADVGRLSSGRWVSYLYAFSDQRFVYSDSDLPTGWAYASHVDNPNAANNAIAVSGNSAYILGTVRRLFRTNGGTLWTQSTYSESTNVGGECAWSNGGTVIMGGTNFNSLLRITGGGAELELVDIGQGTENIDFGNGQWVSSGSSTLGFMVSQDDGASFFPASAPTEGIWKTGFADPPFDYKDRFYPLPLIVQEICDMANAGSHIDVSLLDGYQCRGFTIGNAYTASGCLQSLSSIFMFDPYTADGRVGFVPRGRDSVATILDADMIDDEQPVEDGNSRRGDPINVPRVLHLNYYDVAGGLNTDKQRSERPEGTRAEGDQSLQTTVTLSANEAASVVARTHGLMVEQQKGELNFSLPDNWLRLTESDPVFVQTGTKMVRAIIARVETDDGEQRYKAIRDRQSLYTTEVQGIPAAPVTRPPSSVAGSTLLEFLDIPILRDTHDQLGFYLAVSGILPAWPGASVELSLDGGENYIEAGTTRTASIIGELVTALGDHPYPFPDTHNVCEVQIQTPNALLENTTLAGMMNRRNRALIGDEIVNFAEADETSEGTWELSHWLRGRKGTDTESHAIGDRFVLLDTAMFIPAELAWLGQDLTFRAVTFGRPVDEATIVTVPFTGQSQVERRPAYLQARRDGTDAVISWQGVGRLGGGAHVAMGAHFAGYRVTLTDGSTTQTHDTSANALTTSLSAFSGPVTVTLQQRNNFTGLGPDIEVTI